MNRKLKKDNKFETVEETPELNQAFKDDFKKYRLSFKEDNEIKKDVDTIAFKLAEDPANADLQVVNHEQIQNLLTKRRRRCVSHVDVPTVLVVKSVARD